MVKHLRSKSKTHDITLVLEPTARQPWIGIFRAAKKAKSNTTGRPISFMQTARYPITRHSPSQVDYWPALQKLRTYLPPAQILVITGPGPFSFTRTAVNIANGLAFGWDIPVYGIDRGPDSLFKKTPIPIILSKLLKDEKTDNSKNAAKNAGDRTFNSVNRALPFYPKKA